MPQVSNISMLGAPILVQILALLYSRSGLSDVLPPAANIIPHVQVLCDMLPDEFDLLERAFAPLERQSAAG